MRLAPLDLTVHGPQVLEIQRAAYRIEAELIGDDRIPTLHESLDDLLAAPLTWLGVFKGSSILGALGWTIAEDALEIDRLFVAPAAARRGVGRSLVSAVIDVAGELPVVVSTGRDNAPAVALYESLGFARTADAEVLDDLWITQLRRLPTSAPDVHRQGTGRPGSVSPTRRR